jgi:hypothetical protein
MGAELYAGNTAGMWASLAPWSQVASGTAQGLLIVDIPVQRATRVIVRQPLAADPGPIGACCGRPVSVAWSSSRTPADAGQKAGARGASARPGVRSPGSQRPAGCPGPGR